MGEVVSAQRRDSIVASFDHSHVFELVRARLDPFLNVIILCAEKLDFRAVGKPTNRYSAQMVIIEIHRFQKMQLCENFVRQRK